MGVNFRAVLGEEMVPRGDYGLLVGILLAGSMDEPTAEACKRMVVTTALCSPMAALSTSRLSVSLSLPLSIQLLDSMAAFRGIPGIQAASRELTQWVGSSPSNARTRIRRAAAFASVNFLFSIAASAQRVSAW
jgi:hypothetical protein